MLSLSNICSSLIPRQATAEALAIFWNRTFVGIGGETGEQGVVVRAGALAELAVQHPHDLGEHGLAALMLVPQAPQCVATEIALDEPPVVRHLCRPVRELIVTQVSDPVIQDVLLGG
ncbi:hypothetical protein [Streptomyces niger]|uniref:hypothetical protein n=1 Tax=Streptomyces niger TaxID=66373 RepID=UPI0018FE54BE|nr:hypothetical protein [Streptomyces niger]